MLCAACFKSFSVILNEGGTLNNEFVPRNYSIVETDTIDADFQFIYADAAHLSEISPEIVIGTIAEIKYSDKEARPTILEEVEINTSLRGELIEGEVITVEEFGGYVRIGTYVKKKCVKSPPRQRLFSQPGGH